MCKWLVFPFQLHFGDNKTGICSKKFIDFPGSSCMLNYMPVLLKNWPIA